MTVLRGLPPVIDVRARILILGSFPSAASLSAQQYYAHRRNQFWPLLAELIGAPLPALDYAARLDAAKAAGIAIWDVLAACERTGSLDAAIRNGRPNDFGKLKKWAPALEQVCFNGQAAGRFVRELADLGYRTAILPSTSPAHTLGFVGKLQAWRAGMGCIEL